MITDRVENAASYVNLGSRIATALGFVSRHDLNELKVGRYPIEGESIFAMVQEYQTKKPEETFWESHRRYIDVQFIHSGEEAMGWSPIQGMKLKTDYELERDIVVWEGAGQRILLPAGHFVIFMPHDAHMGGLLTDHPRPVRKVVVKVGVE